MANTLNLGNGNWATKEDSLLAYNSENGNFKPLPFDFTRASSATRINKNGLIETVGGGKPRIDFKDNTKGALLLEPTRSNLIPYSQDFSNAAWGYQNVTINSNQIIAPDGTLTADKITDNSTNSAHRITDGNTTSSSGSFTYSIFLKKGTLTTAQIQVFNSATASSANVDLVNGTITSGGQGVNHTIQNYGNDWFKCSISGTLSNTATTVYLYLKQKPSYIGNGDYLYAWGAQLEEGSYATSYIPTSGSSVTRVADVCNNGGNDQVINSIEGVLYLETKGFIDVPSDSGYIQLSKNGESSATNSLIIQHRNNGYLRIYVNGFGNNDIHFNINIDFTENHKIAVLYKLNGYKLFIDGVAQNLFGTPTQTVFSGLDNLSFDLRGALSWNASIKEVKIYNTALTDQELQALTT